MSDEFDLNLKIKVPEKKEPADRGKLSIFIDRELFKYYHEKNEGRRLTGVVRDAIEQALSIMKQRDAS